MRRQLGVGLLTKITRNGPSTNLVSLKSSFLKPNSIPFHQRSLSEYSTLSRSHLWKICCPNGLRGTIQNGALPTSLLARRVFSNALLQGRAKFPVTFRNRRSLASFSLDRRRRSFFRRFTTNGVVLGLIVTNVAVFILWKVADPKFMVKNFMISLENIKHGQLHTMITNAFSHRDAFHLTTNMLGLYFFGTSIGQNFGPQYLLKLYLGGAIAGSIFFVVYQAFIAPSVEGERQGLSHSQVPALGASGAVNAIMLLNIFLFPTATILVDLIIPVPAFLVGVFMIGNDMLRVWKGDTEISGAAHLGGAAVAAFAWLRIRKGRIGRF